MGRTKFRFRVKAVLVAAGVWEEELMKDIPQKWERHGDLAIVGKDYFQSILWKDMDDTVWHKVCSLYHATRMARCNSGLDPDDGFRTPSVEFLYNPGGSPFAIKKENGIMYKWNVTKCMFSSGNITEKLRIANFNCEGQIVVDMFAGIGYFTLSYLVHAKAARVFAIDWNQEAADALQENLMLNKVEAGRCIILVGDNRKICPLGVADHVNLGLIPSSKTSWRAGVQALNRARGGILHIHDNVYLPKNGPDSHYTLRDYSVFVTTRDGTEWIENVKDDICKLVYEELGYNWEVNVEHISTVKSYAPRVDHMVLDIRVTPGAKSEKGATDEAGTAEVAEA